MPWPVTINGRTYTEEDFQPFKYPQNFPEALRDVSDVALAIAATKISVDTLYAALLAQTFGQVPVTGTAVLSLIAHNGRILQVSGAGSITALWADTGAGFSCLIANQRATSLSITASGAALQHPDGHSRVRVGGMAALVAVGGSAPVFQLVGQTE